MPLKIPSRYKVEGKPLNGGMSLVYPHFDSVLERKVAIKIVPPGPNVHRIKDELAALLSMRSKHVVQVYDVMEESGEFAIIQEFIEGDDLFSESTKPSDPWAYMKLLWQIARGISNIHDAGIIHRDIKPNNMKLDPEEILKIFDFGLSREDGPKASTVGFVGTHGFAAPELYSASATFTKAIDVFAFGATALFVALRDLPDELKKSKPPIALSENPFASAQVALPEEVQEVLARCLSVEASKRPDISEVEICLSRQLLFDQHRALVVYADKAYFLDRGNRSVGLMLGDIASVQIKYDGHNFSVAEVAGDVFINNAKVSVGSALPGACVLTLGGPELGNKRGYVTFDLSHPEIVL